MTFGTIAQQRQILSEIQQLNLNGAFEMPKRMTTAGVDQADVNALYAALEGLGADVGILATIGSWGDTLRPEAVLEILRGHNPTRDGQ